jgi:hypothetical protein
MDYDSKEYVLDEKTGESFIGTEEEVEKKILEMQEKYPETDFFAEPINN